MINAKIIINNLLNDERITNVVDNIMDFYPEEIETFPCIIFQENGQNDREFADNLPIADEVSYQIHIYTKALADYPTTSEIGLVVAQVMKENFFTCSNNREVPDVDDNVRHRVMEFRKSYLS